MANMYANLVSPRKNKRRAIDPDDDNLLTPKRFRIAPPTPPATTSRRRVKEITTSSYLSSLPAHLSRLCSLQSAIQQALSHALATSAISPASDNGVVRAVLNHLSLSTYSGLDTQFSIDDLKRLCWMWEWDGKKLPKPTLTEVDDNPFLDTPAPSCPPSDWMRGGMGIAISATTHFSKSDRKRVPAYGIGIEVEIDIDKDMKDGIAAIARWTSITDIRNKNFRTKAEKWIKLHGDVDPPQVPFADLPQLPNSAKLSALTKALVSASPKGSFPSKTLFVCPSSPGQLPPKSPSKSPAKRPGIIGPIPFPSLLISPIKSPAKMSGNTFPQTPSRHGRNDTTKPLIFPHTPSSPVKHGEESAVLPSTPTRQRGTDVVTAPQTPTTSRRRALYDRVRMKALASPSKLADGARVTKEQLLKANQEEVRRKCLLGRLDGVAESVWMLFSKAVGASTTSNVRRRRTMPTSEVVTAVVKSSPVPISSAEAMESIEMLVKLCPFFIKQLDVDGDDWLEMPAPSTTESTPRKTAPPSPTKDSAMTLLTRSPRQVKRETGGLREVREIIRREQELQD